MSKHANSQDCSGSGRKVSLTVLGNEPTNAKPHSRRGYWRAAVLVLVHLLIIAHIVQWRMSGSTVSPVEPSESMQTLELGEINAGFIFFVIAILATLVFGRFFCGWGCHVVALQDLCTWMMNKLGVRPKPFRSRLLVWAPLAFGLYMFVWPTFKRMALFPLLGALGLDRPVWLRDVSAFHGFASELIVTDFWATFPPWYVAIPFFAVIGFAAVYFLGSKGFCTYGCPYGGIFGVADIVSPGRIVVNDNCHSCGHCTAVCTSNVRVHEEIRDFGMVMDPGCMKCMDCVSACPNDALSFGFAKPAVLRKPADSDAKARQRKIRNNSKRFDLTWSEEIALAVVFIAIFLGYRGMLDLVPMLMAAGMAGIGTFIVWKGWSLITKPNVRVQSLVLKQKGRIKPAGAAAMLLAIFVAGSAAWSGTVNSLRFGARLDHERIDVPISIVFRPEYEPTESTLATARRGLSRFAFSDKIGWSLNAEQKREAAYLALIAGGESHAESFLSEIMAEGNPTEELVRQQLALMHQRGATPGEQLDALQGVLTRHSELVGLAPDIAMRLITRDGGSYENADAFWDDLIKSHQSDGHVRLLAAEYFISTRRSEQARPLLPDDSEPLTDTESVVLARARLKMGEVSGAKELLGRLSAEENLTPAAVRLYVSLWMATGDVESAEAVVRQAIEATPRSPALHELLGQLMLAQGNTALALAAFRESVTEAEEDPWVLLSLGESITLAGLQTERRDLIEFGLSTLRNAARLRPDSPLILHDLGKALLASGELEEGRQAINRAAELAPENEAIRKAIESASQQRTGGP